MRGPEVCQEFMETDMVTTTCGRMVEGTPDGGFKEINELLTLVQVVRVPLLAEMDATDLADVLYDTVLAKIVKSQMWMKQTCVFPDNFIVFCWLPPDRKFTVFSSAWVEISNCEIKRSVVNFSLLRSKIPNLDKLSREAAVIFPLARKLKNRPSNFLFSGIRARPPRIASLSF